MTSDAERSPAAELADFSLVRGGLIYRLGLRLGRRRHYAQFPLGILIALAAWVPLLVLTAIEGSLLGGANVSFAASLATHTRFLAAIPLLFAAEVWIDPHLGSFVHQVAASRLVPPDKLGDLHRAVRSAARWRDSVIVEASLMALAILLVAADVRWDLPSHVSTWRTATSPTGPHLSPAGWWYTIFALPVFQFVVGRWGWRILIWWAFLWRLSRLAREGPWRAGDGAGVADE